jgi:hypothetical protein
MFALAQGKCEGGLEGYGTVWYDLVVVTRPQFKNILRDLLSPVYGRTGPAGFAARGRPERPRMPSSPPFIASALPEARPGIVCVDRPNDAALVSNDTVWYDVFARGNVSCGTAFVWR